MIGTLTTLWPSTMNALIDAGIGKGLFGQWGYDYPDHPQQLFEDAVIWVEEAVKHIPTNDRYDWMQDLLEWFEYYLQERSLIRAMDREVQDNYGEWRLNSIDIHQRIRLNG